MKNQKTFKEKLKNITLGTLFFLSISSIIISSVYFSSEAGSKKYLVSLDFQNPKIIASSFKCHNGTLNSFDFIAVKEGKSVEGYICATRMGLGSNIVIEKTIQQP